MSPTVHALMAIAALMASSVAGWLTAGLAQSEAIDASVQVAAPAPPVVQHARENVAPAAFAFGVPEATTESVPAEFAPAEPDVAETLRRVLTAIVAERGRRVAIIVDPAAQSGRRTLRVGSTFRDGWRVTRINEASVELRRRGETREVSAFTPPSPDEESDQVGDASDGVIDVGQRPARRQALTRADAKAAMQEE